MSTAGIVALAVTLAVAGVGGLLLRARDGRVRTGGAADGGWALAGTSPQRSDRVLLLQLSSPVCAPCRQTAALLADLSTRRTGVVHREVDVAEHPEVARRLSVMRTPTVVAFDRAGAELARVSGVPRVAALEELLAPELGR